MNTDKKHIKNLAKICAAKGIKTVVLSPGSRCAPLVIAFNRQKEIECLSIVDERSAAFFALGIAQQTQNPVGLVCTSGSAILNYAPAIAEAFYQKIPLVLFTADRPNEWIDQGENQSIQQFEVYKNYIKKSFQLPVQIREDKDIWYSDRIVSEAINSSLYPDFGPIHVNIPLREPLYNLEKDIDDKPKIIEFPKPTFTIATEAMNGFVNTWNESGKKLIVLGGQKAKNQELESIVQELSKDKSVVVLKESISNLYGENFIDTIDPLIEVINHNDLTDFNPDLILTLGGGVVSKKLKFWLRKVNPETHWHLTKNEEHWDNFQSLSHVINTDSIVFLKNLEESSIPKENNYQEQWYLLNENIQLKIRNYKEETSYCDLTVFDFIFDNLPKNINLHLGNSTPVRYANLISIPATKNWKINSNRGVSGIDGQTSTAVGAAHSHSEQMTICISGDLAFMYDSNGLWNNYLSPNFKLIVINNGGGNIFRIIPGPSKLEELDKYFETQNKVQVEPLAKMHDMAYFSAVDFDGLQNVFHSFISENKKAAVLEINTLNEESAQALKYFFEYLING